jgi:hypothetical protein
MVNWKSVYALCSLNLRLSVVGEISFLMEATMQLKATLLGMAGGAVALVAGTV